MARSILVDKQRHDWVHEHHPDWIEHETPAQHAAYEHQHQIRAALETRARWYSCPMANSHEAVRNAFNADAQIYDRYNTPMLDTRMRTCLDSWGSNAPVRQRCCHDVLMLEQGDA